MNLHQSTLSNRLGKSLSPTLANAFGGSRRLKLLRKIVAYGNYLTGRGAGTGWDLEHEVDIAIACAGKKSPVVFDVGANVGDWSLLFKKKCSSAKIYLFEPQPVCQITIRDLKIADSELIPFAVSDQKGRFEFFSSADTDGTASLFNREETYFAQSAYRSVLVDVIVLDDLIAERGIEHIDFIKFDIEGNELAALRGLKKAIESGKVGAFSFEFGSGNLNSRSCFRDFWKLIEPGYELYRISPGRKLLKIGSYYEDMEYYRGVSNYVAVKKGSSVLRENTVFQNAIIEA